MTGLRPLADSYAEARIAFGDAAGAAGAHLTPHVHPRRGPTGEELAVDVAELGPADAEDVVLVVSATHGVEGYCGSALQRNWLLDRRGDRPSAVRMVLVHALNPFGFAWVRRVNEDNVDLNRNFLDWTQPAPRNDDYDAIADVLVPQGWTPADQERTNLELIDLVARQGLDAVQSTVSRGQYTQPDGVFYGGSGPVWSNRWLHGWAQRELAGCRRLTIVDIHTGLGPWGNAELISGEPEGTAAFRRAEDLWGKVSAMGSTAASGAVLEGDWLTSAAQLAPHASVTGIALEFGTIDPVSVLQALRADAWLHAHGDPTGADAPAVRAQVRAAFADDDPGWLEVVWGHFVDVIDRAISQGPLPPR